MMRRRLRQLIELLLPTRCVVCQHLGAKVVCTACLAGLEPVGRHCLRCGRRRETEYASPDCGECYGQKIGVRRTRSVFIYNETARMLLAEYKYHGRIGVGLLLLEGLQQKLSAGSTEWYGDTTAVFDLVVPVPLHRSRLRTRRFNQSELLARSIAQQLHINCHPQMLERTRETPSQVGLSANQRQQNVRGAFAVPQHRSKLLADKCVLLVDDLMTTGATLAACARALQRGGASAVYGLTMFSTCSSITADGPAAPATH